MRHVCENLTAWLRAFRWAGDSIATVPSGRECRPNRVEVRYRRADGEFAETTLDRVVLAEVVAGLPVREFRWYKGGQHYPGFPPAL